MNLRFTLLLITALSYIAIGVTWFLTNPASEQQEIEPPFFYTLAPDDLRHIEIDIGDDKTGWNLREDTRRWYFDDMDDIPADLFRWGGITQLLGGPRTQRVLSQEIDDESLYGLDDPSTVITVTLRDESQVKLILGGLTPDGENNYARVDGFPQLVLVDSTWGGVLQRLVTEPPVPEWYYQLEGTVREIILFDNNEVLRAYGYDRQNDKWTVCDIPLETDPCTGSVAADGEALQAEIDHFGQPAINGAIALNLTDDEAFVPYGTTVDSPYIAVRIENPGSQAGVTEVTRLTMTFGDLTREGDARYAVANETSDVISIDAEWADRVLDLFYGEVLIDNG